MFSRIDPAASVDIRTIDERMAMAHEAAGQRLYSRSLACLPYECIAASGGSLCADDVRRLVREMPVLSPNADPVERSFTHLVSASERAPAHGVPLVLVISRRLCKYLEPSVARRQALVARGVTVRAVVGDPDPRGGAMDQGRRPRSHHGRVRGAAMKVDAALESIVMRYGPCAVLKLDDSYSLDRTSRSELLAAISARQQYAGIVAGTPLHDLVWHHGKTAMPVVSTLADTTAQGPAARVIYWELGRRYRSYADGSAFRASSRAGTTRTRRSAITRIDRASSATG